VLLGIVVLLVGIAIVWLVFGGGSNCHTVYDPIGRPVQQACSSGSDSGHSDFGPEDRPPFEPRPVRP
jgi:hypothetical protein